MTRVFGVDYKFLACGDVFTQGLVHGAADLGIAYAHTDWQDPQVSAKVHAFKPDLVFVVHGRKCARRIGAVQHIPSAVWLLDEPYEVDDTAAWSSRFDQVFVNDPATLDRHPGAVYLPVCADPQLHWAGTGPRPYRVGFIGGGNATRDRYLAALAQAGLLSYVVGGPWTDRRVQAVCKSRNIPAAQTPDWYRQTQIIVNVFREVHHYNRRRTVATSLNPRVYEALACGALVVSEWRPECDTLLPEMPTFRSVSECVSVVSALLADPERAAALQRRCADRLREHTYAARLQSVLTTMARRVAA